MDVDAWIDHHILNVMTFNVDALRLSAYFYKPRNGKLVFGPIWDFDRALESTDGRDANPRVWRSQVSDLGTDFFNYPWWGKMFTDPDFWQKWIDRWQELRLDRFSLTNLNTVIDGLCNQVRSSQPRELAKWGVQPRGGSYQGEINYTKNWLASTGELHGHELSRQTGFQQQRWSHCGWIYAHPQRPRRGGDLLHGRRD